jgi:L-2-hydroxyglutarate oxidase LhgO
MAARLTPEQLAIALELQRKGKTHEAIAKQLDVHRQTVGRSLNRHNRKAWDRLEKRTAAEKAKQVERLEWLFEQAATAWANEPDPALINQARGTLSDIRQLMGLNAPTKTQSDVTQTNTPGITRVELVPPLALEGPPNDRGGE